MKKQFLKGGKLDRIFVIAAKVGFTTNMTTPNPNRLPFNLELWKKGDFRIITEHGEDVTNNKMAQLFRMPLFLVEVFSLDPICKCGKKRSDHRELWEESPLCPVQIKGQVRIFTPRKPEQTGKEGDDPCATHMTEQTNVQLSKLKTTSTDLVASNPATKSNPEVAGEKPSDSPRCDDVINPLFNPDLTFRERQIAYLARVLERELTASQQEVERLKTEIRKVCNEYGWAPLITDDILSILEQPPQH